jgi:hypothetical protein
LIVNTIHYFENQLSYNNFLVECFRVVKDGMWRSIDENNRNKAERVECPRCILRLDNWQCTDKHLSSALGKMGIGSIHLTIVHYLKRKVG